MRSLLERLMDLPMSAWAGEAEADVNTVAQRGERAAHACVWLARFVAYLNARSLGWDHDAAVKEQNKVAAKVRKALGYTYPNDPVSF